MINLKQIIMKVTIEDDKRQSFSEAGNSPSEIFFNALRGSGMSDEAILKDMYSFSSRFVKPAEEKMVKEENIKKK